ncbi:MAG TPA: NADH-quinone oxidoreductase subunit A [Anaerolineae bacterium]|nr:NADH-quinone oxidoreductase subunit A [Anaerolineae bacterium]HNS52896.1 NADH-quinone oxidoreductase subunit A [Anaerolineae bacterium]
MPIDFFPILLYGLVAVALSAIAIAVPSLLGPKRPSVTKLSAFESGKLPIGPARRRFSIQYYLYAVLFLLFDIGVLLLFPWAVVFRDLASPWVGLVQAGVFCLVLGSGLLYVWKRGGLEWD